MGHFSQEQQARRNGSLEGCAAKPVTALPSGNVFHKFPETGDPRPLIPTKRAPVTTEMLHPRSAWRRLCADTGGHITIGTFYRWIRIGRLYTVRLGGKVFVPLSALETLIDHCMRGESL
jgi:hypothetical protein